MKLVRHGDVGKERPGLIDREGTLRDLGTAIGEIDGAALAPASLARLAKLDPASLPSVSGTPRFGPPIARIGKIVAIGLNYSDHAAETNATPPKEPIIFMKATTSLAGPDDPLMLPRGSEKTDWEVELAAVIGTTARYVEARDALRHVAGYCVCNDVSERAFQIERGGQWVKGKSADGFAPLGPWLVTADEVPDPQALDLWLDVNGLPMPRGSTRNMIFGVAFLVSYVSQFMTLEPGDVLTTGTPAGVGLGKKPPVFLRAGDEIRLGIEGLGEQRQSVVAFRL
jgi:2-keto-4-pentenoate hydratase/2-oxohepta-3-ene-1,7-dioic acid hydratase in catechol pathway